MWSFVATISASITARAISASAKLLAKFALRTFAITMDCVLCYANGSARRDASRPSRGNKAGRCVCDQQVMVVGRLLTALGHPDRRQVTCC